MTRKLFAPLYHKSWSFWKSFPSGEFDFVNKTAVLRDIALSDADTARARKGPWEAFKKSCNQYVLNLHLDMEVFPILPYKEGKTFLIPFYEPGWQTNFKVLLNGRETAMFTQNVKDALKGFPGALITRVEVITSPSAKYDAEGVGGIINIITKKKVAGYNGTVSYTYNSLNWHFFTSNFSAKFGKLGVGGNFDL